MIAATMVNVSRRSSRLALCSMCGEWRASGQQRDPAVIVIAGYALCARHLALVHAIRDDAAVQKLPNRVPVSRTRRRGAL